jgi:O-antigen/teichoic acid export membrane protein
VCERDEPSVGVAKRRSRSLAIGIPVNGRRGGRFSFLVSSSYATISAGSAALLLLLLMVAGRFLSADDYGRFSFALALATIVETIMDIGLGPVTVREVARDRDAAGRIFRNVLGLKLAWVAGGLAVLLVLVPILRSDGTVIRVCYLLGISSAVRSYLLTVRGLLQGLNRFDIEAAVVVTDRVLLLVFGTVALAGGYGLYGLSFAFVGARLLMCGGVTMLVHRLARSAMPTFDRKAWRRIQTAALPLGFFMIALNLYTYIDTVILGLVRSDAETGWYAAAYRVYEGLTYAPAVMSAVLTPRFSYLFVHDRDALRTQFFRALGGAAALGIALGAAGVLLAHAVLPLLFGASYAPAVAPLQVLSGGALLVFSTWILHAAAIATNLDRRLLVTTIVGLASNVALNLLFIPRWGISGAAWATVVAEAATVVLLFVQVQHRMRTAPPQAAA